MMPYVLVVDDEPDSRLLAQMILRSNGYEVAEAPGGEPALELIEERMPDLLLLDIRMPRVDGWSVLEQLRRDHPTDRPKVIVLSAHSEGKVAGRITKAGAEAFLTKPVAWDELLTTVAEVLA